MSSISGKPQTMKEINYSLVMKHLKKTGSATRAEISEATGISSTTVRSLLDQLIDNKEVVKSGLDRSTGGRRAERYALNMAENRALAFYIENDYISYVVCNPLGEYIEEKTIKIKYEKDKNNVIKILDDIIGSKSYIKVIGIAVPGVVDLENRSYFAGKKLNHWKNVNIGEYIENKYNIPVILENDMNSIALGYSLNLMKKLHVDDLNILNMIYIHFTRAGIGAGIIADGQLIRGGRNLAGEIGFIPVGDGDFFQSYMEKVIDDNTYIEALSRVIATINCVINPDIVVIGGETFRFNLIDKIKEVSSIYAANKVIPDIFLAEDSKYECFTGIIHLTLEQMYSSVMLVNDTKKLF